MAEKSKSVAHPNPEPVAQAPVAPVVQQIQLPNSHEVVAQAVAQAAIPVEKKPRKPRAAGSNANNILVRMKAQKDEIEELKKRLESSSVAQQSSAPRVLESNQANEEIEKQEPKREEAPKERQIQEVPSWAHERQSEPKPAAAKKIYLQNLRFPKKRF